MPRELVWSDDPTPRKRRLRLLVLGPPKIGKSVAVVGTCPQPSYVINCDQDDSLDHVQQHHPSARFAQERSPVHSIDDMERALQTARRLVKEGSVKTVILDTLSGFSQYLIKECEELNPDGRKYYPAYTNYIVNVCSRICEIPAHVIVTSHYIETSSEESAEAAKTGPGLVPLLETRGSKARVGGQFSDVVFFEYSRKLGRIFVTDMQGVWGPGCRNIHGKKVETSYRANIRTLMRAMGMLKPKSNETGTQGIQE
jgi:AAA domain